MDASTSSTPKTQSSTGASTAKPIKHAGLQELCARRDGGETLPASSSPLRLEGFRLVEADLSGLDLSRADFSGAELVNCNFADSRLVGANLTDAVVQSGDFARVEFLSSDISRADFTNANLDHAGLGTVTANETVFFGATCTEATFSGSDLSGSDLRAGTFNGARMMGTNLDGAVCDNAVLAEVDLSGASVSGASFHNADFRGAQLRGVTGYKDADWIDADIQSVDFTGAWNLRRHVQDENYIHEFRSQSAKHELLYKVWWVTSDCGRSLSRWSIWTVLVAFIYAGLYNFVDIDWGDYETPLSPVYYSVVTFTTLGYGDVLPGSTGAQLLAMSEVILGYFSLGGMMSILSDKMARRAG